MFTGISILLLMLAAIDLFLGISFPIYHKSAGVNRFLIMLYCICCGVWCLCYGSIGFVDQLDKVWIVRLIGFICIDLFTVIEYFMVAMFTKISKKHRLGIGVIVIGLAIVDAIIFGAPDVNRYVKVGNWTTWYPNDNLAHNIHSVIVFIFFLIMFAAGIIWAKRNHLKRQRRFIVNMFIANFITIFCAIPDTYMIMMGKFALPTSGIGAGICGIVVWAGARKYNVFNIDVGNVTANIYDFINVGILVFDMEKNPVLANPFARKLLGIKDGQLEHFENLFTTSLDSRTKGDSDEILEASLECEEYDRIYAKHNGTCCKTITTVANDMYGQPYCYIVAVYDMTKEIQILGDLQKAMDAKMDFLAAMSHEIRTPINSVLGYNELIGRESSQEQIREYSSNIASAGVSLLGIVNDILDMAKIESNQLELHSFEYETPEMIRECCKLFTIKAKEKGIEFVLNYNEDIPCTLFGDELRIRQAITNIIGNAIKYTPSGKVIVSVDYKEQDEETILLEIKVEDTGIGIAEDQLPFIFDSFKRIEETKNRHIEGSGLGLTITHRIIEMLGGTIDVESSYGKGSCFAIVIPQHIVDAKPSGKMSLSASGKMGEYAPSFENDKFKVLVVDDNVMNLKLFCKLLAPTKLPIDVAENGMEALELIFEKHYDIIFMDHMMPEMDGIETLRRIRANMSHPNQDTPIIMLTANALMSARQTYQEAGFVDYLSKPFTGAELEKMIQKYLPQIVIKEETQVDEVFHAMCKLPEVDGEMLLKNLPSKDMRDEVLLSFVNEKKQMIENLMKNRTDLDAYAICIHSMKNSLKLLGAKELADVAYKLELAAKEKDENVVSSLHEEFVMQYYAFAGEVQSILQSFQHKKADVAGQMREKLEQLRKAMEDFDVDTAYGIAEQIRQMDVGPEKEAQKTKLLEAVRDLALPEFMEAYELLK